MAKHNRRNLGTALLPYLPAVQTAWLATEPDLPWKQLDASLVFADISGFTPLTERLAQRGKVGAEELTDVLNGVFCALLAVAAVYGGDCLKLGGDALLLLFSGPDHGPRACQAATRMLEALHPLRRVRTELGTAVLGMSVGVHSGVCDLFLTGKSHRELVVAGPAVSTVLEMEHRANSGEILVSSATAELLGRAGLEDAGDGAWRLKHSPEATEYPIPVGSLPDGFDAREGLPVTLAEYLTGAGQEGEHRLATVGFLQFGDTDELLASDGPPFVASALSDLINEVQRVCSESGVSLLGTDVDQNAGKVILAAGVPAASPDDDDRMLHALRSLLDSSPGVPLRAGVTRGRVFAVDLGSPARRCYTVMGDTVNLAARLMSRAGWGELLAAEAVLERVRTEYALTRLEPFTVKGKSQPIHAASIGRLIGGRQTPSGQELPLVGRHRELTVIREAMAAAHEGQGRIVELGGEPGIGKSRLLAAALALSHELPVFSVEAGRYSHATPYFALRRSLRRLVGAGSSAGPDEAEAALRASVERAAPDLLPWLPLIRVPLGLESEETPETARLDPAFRQAKLQASIVKLLTSLLPGPALITIEDAHWLDVASTDMLVPLLADVGHRPWAVLATRRQVSGGLELDDRPGLVRVALEPIDDKAARTMATALAQDAALPPGMVDELIARSGGNPLFLQELMAAAMAGPLRELPDSIEAVIAAGIDTLAGDDRALLRQAAVLGSKFPIDVLGPLLDRPAARLRRDLARLDRFLARDTASMVRFRSALVRDVAYEGLAFRSRRELHARAGAILERSAGEHPEEIAELLSIHFHEAGSYHGSWNYSCAAGERAQHNSAPVEAAAFYSRALDAARYLEVSPGARAEIAERLGDVSELSGRYEQADGAYRLARRLARGDRLHLAGLCQKQGRLYERKGQFSQALRWFRRGFHELDEAPAGADGDRCRAWLDAFAGASHLRRGRHRQALPLLEEAVRLAEASGERAALAHACRLLYWANFDLGDPRPEFNERALAIYEELGDELGQANTLNNMGIGARQQGNWEEAVGLYERSLAAGKRAGALVQQAIWICNVAEIRCDQGRIEEAEQLFQEALAIWRGAGDRFGIALALSNLGRAAAHAGRLDEAAERLRDARAAADEIGAEALVLDTDLREMERLVLAGDHGGALDAAGSCRVAAERLQSQFALATLERLAGVAFCQSGRASEGWTHLNLSLSISRECGEEYETALVMQAMAQAAELLEMDRGDELGDRAQEIFDRLGVVGVPVALVSPGS